MLDFWMVLQLSVAYYILPGSVVLLSFLLVDIR